MNHFPAEINAWKNDVARRLVRLRGEVDGIMINLPMIPDPEIGMPFTGPLSPVPFQFPQGGENTGGTDGTLAGHCSHCPLALRQYEIVVSGIAVRSCAVCGNLNGTHILTANDAQHAGSGSVVLSSCAWSSQEIAWCVSAGDPQHVWWVMTIDTSGPGGTPRVRVSPSKDPNGFIGFSLLAAYYRDGCPPESGSGSGIVTLTRPAGTPLDDCQNYPATITLRGIS